MSDLDASDSPIVDLDDLIDGQKVRRSAITFLVIAILGMIADGFDLSAMGYVAPELVKEWHVAPSALVPAFSAGVFGLLLGAPLLGMVGDRIGRKKAVLFTLSAFGVLTLLAMTATNLSELVILRFLTGLGLGGLIPNIIALAAEVAPKRLRGMFIIIVNFGVPAGIALPGLVAALFVTRYGWQVLFLVGGILPLVIALCAFMFLPESIRYLLQQGNREEQVRHLAKALRPELLIGPQTRIVTPSLTSRGNNGSPAKLFAGALAIITPLLWIILAANQFANFFMVSWLPTLLQSSGSSTAQAAVSASMFPLGGLVGGFVLLFVVDRFGIIPMVVLFLLGTPIIAAIGFSNGSSALLGAVIACAGFCVTGNNFAINAALGMIYPTSIRSTGAGWGQALGRVGALGAQVAGGILLAQHLALQEVFLAPAVALGIAAAASSFLVILCFRRFDGYRVHEMNLSHITPLEGPVGKMAS